MQGAVRRQGSSLAKRCNAADADPDLNPEGRLPAGALRCCGWLVENDYTSLPRALHCIPQVTGAGHDFY